jgi:predicted nucleotidyltransferase component of viral defense system
LITSRAVLDAAEQTGFRPEIVEKVLRLNGILGRLHHHPGSEGVWVLKGGTALNLFHLDVPRLSVDIDLNFVGSSDLEGMEEARPGFEGALTACCEREGCSVKRTPTQHAGGKFRLRYPSVLGGSQNLEVDVSYVARVPLFGTKLRTVRFPPDSALEVPVLHLDELAAGKFTALAQRSAPRDAFDAASLLDLVPDLLERHGFRLAFVCSVAASRNDCRMLRSPEPRLDAPAITRELEPLLRRVDQGAATDSAALARWMSDRLRPVKDSLLAWSENERGFLDLLLDEGEIDATLLTNDRDLRDRVMAQPMLRWKAQNVREHRGRG